MLKTVLLITTTFSFTYSEYSLADFQNRNKLFTAAVYKQVSNENLGQNFLVCPFSAETILALVQNGAKGATGDEIRNILHFPNSTQVVNKFFKRFLPTLKHAGGFTLDVANRIYVQKSYPIREEFAGVAKRIYQSRVHNIDFRVKKKAAKVINNWIARKTKDKINNLIDFRNLNDDTVAVLINALYLNIKWQHPFNHAFTRPADFHSGGEVFKAKMMRGRNHHGYYESAELDAKFLKIPTAPKVSVVFVLPNKKSGLGQLEAQIDKVYATPVDVFNYVNVSLPTFEIETSIDFKSVLKNLGVNRAFTKADFSGMAGAKGEICISEVLQKTRMKVNEDGIEAAAATSVAFTGRSLMITSNDFIADHPFLFYIQIDGVVFFTGRVVKPATL